MENIIRKNSLSLGITLGAILSIITAIMYSIDLSLFTSTWIGILNFVLIIGIGIYASIKNKKALKGIMSFKEAFASFIGPILIGVAIYILFNILLFNVIDPEAKVVITENVIEMTENMLAKFGVPQAEIDKAITEIESKDNFGFGAQIQSYFWYAIIYSLIGLLVALIFKTPASKH